MHSLSRTSEWSAGYVTEIGYSYGFYRELNPSTLALAALLRGIQAPGLTPEPLRVLELGCGQGESAVIIATTQPEVDYIAIDFNPAHIAGASILARNAGIHNLTLRDASFADIAADDSLGQFDIITLHGIYTWVSAENREHILTIAREKLRPGGLLYVSYNCHPGWTPMIPLRRLMTDIAAATPRAAMPERIRASLGLAQRLAEVNARAVGSIPGLKERLEKMGTMAPSYIAHEYMNADWTIFHSADVAAEMSRAKLTFVASTNPHDAIDQLNFTSEQQKLVAEQSDSTLRETLRDLITNQQFRRDVFMRGPLSLRAEEAQERWHDLRLVLLMRAQDVPRKINSNQGEVTLHAPTYDAILGTLSHGPRTVREMLSDPTVAGLPNGALQQAVMVLVGANALAPALPLVGEEERAKRTDLLNSEFLKRARSTSDHNFLASPVTGMGYPVDRTGQLFLLALRKKVDPARFVWGVFSAQGQRLLKDGKTLQDEGEMLAELATRFRTFEEKTLPVLKSLRIVR